MKVRSCILTVLCLLFTRTQAPAKVYNTDKLRQAVEVLCINNYVDTISANQTHLVKLKDGQTIVVRVSPNNAVDHIGIPLFNDQLRTLNPSPIYDFFEYALLNWKYNITPNRLYLKKVLFKKGSWTTLVQNNLVDCVCSIENIDDKLYVVTWKHDDIDIVIVGIPIDYELLCNENRRVIERDFVHQLSEHVVPGDYKKGNGVKEEELKIYGTEGLFVVEGQSYLMPELNQNSYYIFKYITQQIDTLYNGTPMCMTLEDVAISPVLDVEHPIESFSNIIMCNDSIIPDGMLELDLHLSDYHHQQLVLPVDQLKDYCKEQGCELYFAFSGIEKDLLKGILFAKNTAKGYNHLFSISMPKDMMTDKNVVLTAHGYLFIPTITKEKLFGKAPTKKSGAKI